MSWIPSISALTKQLYPSGRAFKMPYNGWLESLHRALALSENKAYTDALAIRYSMLPDNDNFTAEDATDWERRLGMIQQSTAVSLEDRKLAIKRRLNHPGNIKARQHYLYLQGQLRAAGFDVYVYENRFPTYPDTYETRSPIEVVGTAYADEVQHGDIQHGDEQHGGSYANLVVNYIELEKDITFDVGSNLRSTFFIGGNPLGTFAYVYADRMAEFRQLILKLKPVQTVGYLLIIYV